MLLSPAIEHFFESVEFKLSALSNGFTQNILTA